MLRIQALEILAGNIAGNIAEDDRHKSTESFWSSFYI